MEQNTTKVMLISANVGSIFEDPEQMLKLWLQEFRKTIKNLEPGIFALHLQEVGGKNYEASMQHVNHFIKTMLASEELQVYDRARVFLDEDFTAVDKFTALGNIYFIHESVEKVEIWDFQEFKFLPVEGKEVLSGNIENVATKEKAKFPQNFFPEFKWSRKGFLRTRWNINNSVFDLVNIHLFHDASNIVAMQSSPSLYCGNRHQALMHTLKRFEDDKYEKVPLFIFGDFNFRLDSRLLIESITSTAKEHQQLGKKDQLCKVVYTDEGNNGKVLLTVETKAFDHHDKHEEVFGNHGKWLHQFDKEIQAFKEKLHEYDINFPPSYPFSENLKDGMSYMKTRCPSWCDRVLLSPGAKQLLLDDEKRRPSYDLIGKHVCMGDHKPVYLFFHLRSGQGNFAVLSRRSTLKSKISINGEEVGDLSLDNVNIHDFAVFEKEHALPPDFRSSIRQKCDDIILASESHRLCTANKSGTSLQKKKSFQEYAHEIRKCEGVLLRWPKHERHHSSSSEDFDEEDCVMVIPDRDPADPDADSINTDLTSAPNTPSDPPHSPAHEGDLPSCEQATSISQQYDKSYIVTEESIHVTMKQLDQDVSHHDSPSNLATSSGHMTNGQQSDDQSNLVKVAGEKKCCACAIV